MRELGSTILPLSYSVRLLRLSDYAFSCYNRILLDEWFSGGSGCVKAQ